MCNSYFLSLIKEVFVVSYKTMYYSVRNKIRLYVSVIRKHTELARP